MRFLRAHLVNGGSNCAPCLATLMRHLLLALEPFFVTCLMRLLESVCFVAAGYSFLLLTCRKRSATDCGNNGVAKCWRLLGLIAAACPHVFCFAANNRVNIASHDFCRMAARHIEKSASHPPLRQCGECHKSSSDRDIAEKVFLYSSVQHF